MNTLGGRSCGWFAVSMLCSTLAIAGAQYQLAAPVPTDEIKGRAVDLRATSPGAGDAITVFRGQGFAGETEPNGTPATATPLSGSDLALTGSLYPNGDIDYYSFSAVAGDRVYAATMTSFSAGSSTDSQLTLLASDGTSVIEFDDDNGSFAGLSSSIAGAVIPATGTYFLRVNDFTAGTTSERPYELHLRVHSGSPTPEVEPNDTPATANPLPASGWVSGARNPADATEQDWYSLSLNAGDTVFLSLDVDPEDDLVVWNGRLGFALFGDAGNQILVVDDAGTGDVAPNPNRPSEAFFMTVKTAGTYFVFVDSASAAVGGPTATYHLSVSVHPAVDEGVNCTTYTSTDVPKTIGPGTGLVSSVITVPGNPRVADVDVEIVLNHALMQDLDAHLRSPAGNDNGLFTDIGAAATGGQTQMDVVFDDEAGVPPTFTVLKGMRLKPENNSTAGTASTSGGYRLSWFDGENAGGTWTLDLRDDTAGANGGTLTAWSLRICEAPPPPACAPGYAPTTVFSTDFESGAAGFTHTGAQDEWELGLPATAATTTTNPIAAFTSCASGVNCWKTDLDNTYNASCNQDLLSPNINLAGLSAPVVVTWAQRHQVETANFDHMFVDLQQVGGATPVRLYEWQEPTPISASAGTGNPQANIGGSAGWGVLSRRADSLAGLNTELRFHLDSDTSVQFGGLAIDDVSVTACRALVADLAITKTDGVTTAVPGGSVTYTITASNAGPDPVTGATVADTFPAALTCTWTCVGAGGGTCTASGAGNINDTTVNLPAGGSVTYTASCTISAAATGSLSNTAIVSGPISDPNPANNSATDTDTLIPQADVAITKTDGVTTAVPGGSVTYTITASNAGPSNSPATTVADTFPASLTCTWTCVGAGGGTCTAAGSGNVNDTANLPAGGSVTYTAGCAISAAATGSLSNTATVASAVTDPGPGNNAATDTDSLITAADIAVSKTVDNPSPGNGDTVTFTITATNNGPSNATAVSLTDLLPPGLSYVSDMPSVGSYSAVTGVWTIGALASGNSGTLDLVATVSRLDAVANLAAKSAQGEPDPNPANNAAVAWLNAPPSADLQVQESVDDATPAALQDVVFTVTARNAGPSTATGVEISDDLPAGLSFVSSSASQGSYTQGTGVWTVGSLASGATATLQVTATVGAVTPISRTVTRTAQTEPDPVAGNDAATVTLNGSGLADLALSKSASQDPVSAGQTFTYAIVVVNNGPGAATGVTVDDDVTGLGLTVTGVHTSQGTCSAPPAISCSLGTLAPGGSAIITLDATKTVGGDISNTASVAANEPDPNAANNSSGDTSTPVTLTSVTVS